MTTALERVMTSAVAVCAVMGAVRFLNWDPLAIQLIALLTGGASLLLWLALMATKKTQAHG